MPPFLEHRIQKADSESYNSVSCQQAVEKQKNVIAILYEASTNSPQRIIDLIREKKWGLPNFPMS